MLLRDQLDN